MRAPGWLKDWRATAGGLAALLTLGAAAAGGLRWLQHRHHPGYIGLGALVLVVCAAGVAAVVHRHGRRRSLESTEPVPDDSRRDAAKRLAVLEAAEAHYRGELRSLLPSQERIPVEFDAYRLVSPPLGFRGRVSATRDLEKAYRQSCFGPDTGGRLLVVGDPGSGKTIALLCLGLLLCAEARSDPAAPVPVLLSLGGWEPGSAIQDWVVHTLTAAGGLLAGQDVLASRWVRSGILAPFFDGLDEVAEGSARRGCRDALNAYLDAAPRRQPAVLACRVEDYETLVADRPRAEFLAVNAAIHLRPLRQNQVLDYLKGELGSRGDRWRARTSPLVCRVEAEPTGALAELLRLPLWLSLLERSTSSFDALAQARAAEDATVVLLEGYLDATVGPAGAPRRRWASAIAGFLRAADAPDRTTLYPENLTGSYVPKRLRLAFGLAVALAIGLAFGLAVALAIGLAFGLAIALVGSAGPARSRIGWPGMKAMACQLVRGLTFGLAGGLAFGLAFGLVGVLAFGLVRGLTFGLDGALTFGLAFGLVGALVGALVGGLIRSESILPAGNPDAGLRNSRRSALFVCSTVGLVGGLAVGPVFGPVFGPASGPVGGLAVGLVFALSSGGWYVLLQRLARRRAARQNLLPRHPIDFLEDLCRVGLMRRVGGGYQFRHREILEHLAREAPFPGLAEIRRWTTSTKDAPPVSGAVYAGVKE